MCPCGGVHEHGRVFPPHLTSLPPSVSFSSVGGGGQAGVAREGGHPSGPDPVDLRGEAAVRIITTTLSCGFGSIVGWDVCACRKRKRRETVLFLFTCSWRFFYLRLLFVNHLLSFVLIYAHKAHPSSPQPSPALPSFPPSLRQYTGRTTRPFLFTTSWPVARFTWFCSSEAGIESSARSEGGREGGCGGDACRGI